MSSWKVILSLTVLSIAGCYAETITTVNTAGGGTVVFNALCPLAVSSGPVIRGCTNTDATYLNIQTNGTQSLTTSEIMGQTMVAPTSGGVFTTMTFSLTNPTLTFGRLVFNISWGAVTPSLTFTTLFFDGSSSTSSPVLSAASGYFTINAEASEQISSVSFTSTRGLYTIKYIRIDGVAPGDPPVVPEPSTYALFATAFAGLGLLRRYRRNRAS